MAQAQWETQEELTKIVSHLSRSQIYISRFPITSIFTNPRSPFAQIREASNLPTMASSKQNPTGFFDIPPELRMQIYSNVLSTATISTGLGTIPRLRVSAKEKLRLLLVNKLIFAEALPIFYKYHTVLGRINNHPQLRPFRLIPSHRRFDLLVKLDIVLNRSIWDLDTPESDIEISRHLHFVEQNCKYLKSLLLELRPTGSAGNSMFAHSCWRESMDRQLRYHAMLSYLASNPASTQPGFVPPTGSLPVMTAEENGTRWMWSGNTVIDKRGRTVAALRRIWQRLDRLTIVLPTEGDYGAPAFMGFVMERLLETIESEKTWWFGFGDKYRWTEEYTDRRTFHWCVDRGREGYQILKV